jgi:hypothetical protein
MTTQKLIELQRAIIADATQSDPRNPCLKDLILNLLLLIEAQKEEAKTTLLLARAKKEFEGDYVRPPASY